MLYYWLLFFFVAFVSKVILAFAMVYLLLPSDRECSQCGETTLLIRTNRLGRIGFAISAGRIQRRWCPGCRWEGLARRVSHKSEGAGKRADTVSPALHKR